MAKEKISQEFRLNEIDNIRNYFTEEIKQNELISKKNKKICKILNYMKNLVIFASIVNGCVSISAFASLVGILVDIASSAAAIKICVITKWIKKYKPIIKKGKKHDKIVFLAKTTLNTIEFLISKALIDSSITHDEFVSVNNVLKEYDDMQGEINNSNNK